MFLTITLYMNNSILKNSKILEMRKLKKCSKHTALQNVN